MKITFGNKKNMASWQSGLMPEPAKLSFTGSNPVDASMLKLCNLISYKVIDLMYYVYILHGKRYYVGYTNSIENRIRQHMQGKVYSTSRLGLLQLI